jgi:hypothetical protein
MDVYSSLIKRHGILLVEVAYSYSDCQSYSVPDLWHCMMLQICLQSTPPRRNWAQKPAAATAVPVPTLQLQAWQAARPPEPCQPSPSSPASLMLRAMWQTWWCPQGWAGSQALSQPALLPVAGTSCWISQTAPSTRWVWQRTKISCTCGA